jgi:hypothetical protein
MNQMGNENFQQPNLDNNDAINRFQNSKNVLGHFGGSNNMATGDRLREASPIL